ncbi:SNF1-interacting protein [Elasticomyces elasticus]|nr:SNF1-interacting protein [Elasticomyces elasticus]
MATSPPAPPALQPAPRALNLIPVTLKEAALDSPTFRSTTLHFADQIDIIERWLDGYVKAASKLVAEVTALEVAVNGFLSHATPPAQVSEAVLDHDYSMLAMRRYGEGAREFWSSTLRGAKKYETSVVEPIKGFLNNELRTFKDARRNVDATQKSFDHVLGRYLAQSKTKESSSLREDAFQLHEARKAYLKASMDFCVTAPNLRASLDKLIVRIFSEQWKEMKASHTSNTRLFATRDTEMARVAGWSKEMEGSERAFKQELLTARRQIETSAQDLTRPSRELDDYAASTVPYLGTGAQSSASALSSPAKLPAQEERREKQSWLFMKTTVGRSGARHAVWDRRWFYVKNGIFGWLTLGLRSGGVEESDRIGVLLCSVRPAFQEERRFCFEVKTKDASIILQAETQGELQEWISAFEVAKRKALEDPASTEVKGGVAGIDPAFAITPPPAPEFAAKTDTAPAPEDAGLEREATFGPALSGRASFDVTSNASQPQLSAARRVLSLEREPGEGGRDHAARIIQKLDLHKRSTPSSQTTGSTAVAGGIAGLIAASHNILPVGPGAPVPPISSPEPAKRIFSLPSASGMATSTLAPSTLANPPAPTNLSHTAVVVSGERGVGLGRASDGSGMPSGIMANLWGSSTWGYVNRIGDAPVQKKARFSEVPTLSATSPGVTQDDVGIMDGTTGVPGGANPMASEPNLPGVGMRHRKTLSVSTEAPGQSLTAKSQSTEDGVEDLYPANYPLPLKAQQAQFRMLFPSVQRTEKVVLVFRATWNPNEQQEFPGRVYVTTSNIYFYSNHLGMVLVTSVGLDSISDVTAAPGRDCDFLYLHLHENAKSHELRRITIKVFLEPLRLLQRRLNYLVRNANGDEPAGLDEVMKALIKMETEGEHRSSSVESWEDVAYSPTTPTVGGAKEMQRPGTSGGRAAERNVKTSLRVDGTLFDASGGPARTGREVQKFKLPAQAVVYAPQGMQASVSRDFGVSAKALFHVMFGDKSAVFQLLYCNRWADRITQSPWQKAEASANWTREFGNADDAKQIMDVQVVDIQSDHLCYVVTNTKVPWRMPYAKSFTPTTKIVITHTAKSKCKLAVFQAITWSRPPRMAYVRRLVERQVMSALEADALDLTNLAMDQVAKLGHHSKTNRAIEIFGGIGQQAIAPQLDGTTASSVVTKTVPGKQLYKPVGLVGMFRDDLAEKFVQTIGWLLDVLMAIGKGVLGVLTGQTILVAILAVSGLYNAWYGYRDTALWYQERSAGKFMARIGVRPDATVARAVYLSDIDQLIEAPAMMEMNDTASVWNSGLSTGNGARTCRTTFTDEVLTTSVSTTSRTTARLHRTRDSLARYRHDLLVAMRVVNRIERDVVEAEFEEYVRSEAKKCDRVEGLLAGKQKSLQFSALMAAQMLKLVELMPSEKTSAPLICRTVSAPATTKFSALSYVARDETTASHKSVEVDEVSVRIDASLDSALRSLRQPQERCLLWLDPLCLADTIQPPMDPLAAFPNHIDVYNAASKVVVWLGEPRQSTATQFSAVATLEDMFGADPLAEKSRDSSMWLSNPPLDSLWPMMQPLFHLPWWHWERVGALLKLQDPSKVSFRCGSEEMSWNSFKAVVYTLRFWLPRIEDDYSPWLDQILLQIPGTMPDVFREVLSPQLLDAARETGVDPEAQWGRGSLFAHPQDVQYWIKETSEASAAGRLMTRLSTRLANRYKRRCFEKLRHDVATKDVDQDDCNEVTTASAYSEDSGDESLRQWLQLLMGDDKEKGNTKNQDVLQRALTATSSPRIVADETPHSMTDDSYTYTPLVRADREIRILVLYPSADDTTDINCDVINFNVEFWSTMGAESFPYIALSYMWGDRNQLQAIWLGGRRKEVTPNLHRALKGLRDPIVPMLLWVDSLCIDQENAEERNQQVAMMDTIYSGAGAVIAWVGVEECDIVEQHAMVVLTNLESLLGSVTYNVGQGLSNQPLWHDWIVSIKSWGPQNGMDQIFRKLYFTRVWTMQEILLSRNVILCHGGYAVHFHTLLFKFGQTKCWTLPQPVDDEEEDSNVHINRFLSIYHGMLNEKQPSALEGLLLARDRNATIKHDSVYGTLGLLAQLNARKDGQKRPSWQTPSYDKDFYALCLDIFTTLLQETGSLDVLSVCEVRGHYAEDPVKRSNGAPWPSWLPDWSLSPMFAGVARSVRLAEISEHSEKQGKFMATGQNAAKFHLISKHDEDLLSLRGVEVDVVAAAFEDPWDASQTGKWLGWPLPERKEPLPDILRSPIVCQVYKSSDAIMQAFRELVYFGQPNIVAAKAYFQQRGEQWASATYEEVRQVLTSMHLTGRYPSRLFVTAKGHLGRGPVHIQAGDRVVVLYGAKVPYILRPVLGKRDRHSIIGECYIHEIMHGEAVGEGVEVVTTDFILE